MRKELEKYSNSNLNCHFTELFQSTNNSGHIGNPDAISNQLNEYDDTGEPTPGNLITELEQGSSLMLYAGHANEILLSTTGYDVESASITDNISKYFLGCVVGCSIGSHDENYMSLSEKWQVLGNRGSIAMFVSSVLQSWKPPMYMQRELNDSILKVTSVKSIGDLYKDAVLVSEFQTHSNFWYYHILGDPATRFVLTLPELRTISEPEPESVAVKLGDKITGSNLDKLGNILSLNNDGTVVAIAATSGNFVRILKLNGNNWFPQGNEITINDLSDGSIKINNDGTLVVIGAPSYNTGEVHIYQIDTTNSHWSKVGSNDITGTTVFDVFGASVDVSTINNEIVIAVGAYNISSSTHNNCGAVYIYKLDENNSWILVKSIFGESDNERIGNTLSFSNDGLTLAIGGPLHNNSKGPYQNLSF